MSDSESWIFVEPHPKSKVLAAPIRNVEPRIRSPFQVSDSLPSASSKSPPQQAFQSVSDLECSTAAPTFHPPEPRPAPVSLHDLGGLPNWHDPTPDSAGSWSRPQTLCTPPQDLALSPLTTAPEVPPRDCEVFEKSLHMTHPRSSHAIAAPSKFAKVSSSAHKRVRQPSSNPYLAKKWHFVLEQLGNASQLFEACSKSKFGYQHADRVLDNIAPSTALQYLTAICNFLRICQDMRCSIVGLTDGGMADLLLVISLSRSSDSSGISRASSIKALRWLRRSAIVDSLQCVYSSIVDSFLKIKRPKDKREAAPLPPLGPDPMGTPTAAIVTHRC